MAFNAVFDGRSITHDCPFCGGIASRRRALVCLIWQCIKQERAAMFLCETCKTYIAFPTNVFVQGFLEEMKGREQQSIADILNEAAPSSKQVLSPTWGETLRAANVNDTETINTTCPNCGKNLMIPIKYVGQMGTCKYCQGHLKVPVPEYLGGILEVDIGEYSILDGIINIMSAPILFAILFSIIGFFWGAYCYLSGEQSWEVNSRFPLFYESIMLSYGGRVTAHALWVLSLNGFIYGFPFGLLILILNIGRRR